MAMNKDHKPSITCAKCARCIDNCPSEALNYRIKGTSAKVSASTARVIFLYLAYSFMVIFLLEYYSGIITPTALGHLAGIHPKQLWSYLHGYTKPRKKQVAKIENALHRLGKELMNTSF